MSPEPASPRGWLSSFQAVIPIAEPTEPLTLINTYGAWPVVQPPQSRATRAAATAIAVAILGLAAGIALLTAALAGSILIYGLAWLFVHAP